MNTLKSPTQRRILWIAIGLAIFTAVTYLLMVWNVLGVGDLQMDEKPAGIIYFAAGCYLVGGLLTCSGTAGFCSLERLSAQWSFYSSSTCIRIAGSHILSRRVDLQDRADPARDRIDLCHCAGLEARKEMKILAIEHEPPVRQRRTFRDMQGKKPAADGICTRRA